MKYKIMKTIIITLSLFILGLGISTQAQTNLIPNGDFESITSLQALVDDGWNTDAKTNQGIETVNVISGTKSVRFTGVTSGSWLTRDIDVEAGATYIFTFTGRIHAAAGPSGSPETSDGLLKGRIRGGTTTGDWSDLIDNQSNTDTTMTASYTVPEGITKVRLQIYKTKAIAYIDDVSFVKNVPTSLESAQSNEIKACSPYSGTLMVRSNDLMKEIALYSIDGKIIRNASINANEASLNSIEKGIYIVKAQLENGKLCIKKTVVR